MCGGRRWDKGEGVPEELEDLLLESVSNRECKSFKVEL